MDILENKKILFVINEMSFGGAQKLVCDQVNFLHSKGVDVALLTLLTDKRGNFMNRLRISKDKIFTIESKFNLISIVKLRHFLIKNKFDFIVSNLFFSNTLIRAASLFMLKRPKIIIYEHNIYSSEKGYLSLLIDKFLAYFTYKVVAVSEEVRRYLIHNGIPNNKIIYIKNGVEFANTNSFDKLKIRNNLGVKDDEIMLVAVGNVAMQKGHDLLLEAAKKIDSKKFKYFICGSDTYTQLANDIKKMIGEYDLFNNFQLLGNREDVLDIVAAADIFVMPSRWEGLSIALLEAMALSKAILVSDIPSMLSVVTDKKDATIFRSENTDDLVDKITVLAADSHLREELGKNALQTVTKYDIENNVNQLISLYKNNTGALTIFNLKDQKSSKWYKRAENAVAMLSSINFETSEKIVIGDFGCGNKKILDILRENLDLNYEYLGYDLVPQSEDVIKVNLSKEFPDRFFDVVFSMGLIEYLQDVNFFFNNLREKCKYVILSYVISDAGRYTEKDVEKMEWVNHFSSSEIMKIIQDHDFEIMESKILDNGVTYLAILKNKKLN